jgi:hypothetical protein
MSPLLLLTAVNTLEAPLIVELLDLIRYWIGCVLIDLVKGLLGQYIHDKVARLRPLEPDPSNLNVCTSLISCLRVEGQFSDA